MEMNIIELIDEELERLDIKIIEENSHHYTYIYRKATEINKESEEHNLKMSVKSAVMNYMLEVLYEQK